MNSGTSRAFSASTSRYKRVMFPCDIALLPPHGFEGVLPAVVVAHPYRSAVAHCPHRRRGLLDHAVGIRCLRMEAHEHDDLITRLDEVVRRHPIGIPSRKPL